MKGMDPTFRVNGVGIKGSGFRGLGSPTIVYIYVDSHHLHPFPTQHRGVYRKRMYTFTIGDVHTWVQGSEVSRKLKRCEGLRSRF